MDSINRTAERVIRWNERFDQTAVDHVTASSTIRSATTYVMARVCSVGVALAEESLLHKISERGIETQSFFTVDQAREILQNNEEQ